MSEIPPAEDDSTPSSGAVARIVGEIAEYLGLVFKPGAEELGLLVQDQVQVWRLRNLRRLITKLEGSKNQGRVNPRLAISVLEQATRTDDEQLLSMWAGLLESGRSDTDPDDANISFVARLSQMSALQAHILNHLCENTRKYVSGDLVCGNTTKIVIDEDPFFHSINRLLLDQELDNLRYLGLVGGGLDIEIPSQMKVAVTALGIYMYVRCSGHHLAPVDFFPPGALEPFDPMSHESI